jgi:hypothetical protein
VTFHRSHRHTFADNPFISQLVIDDTIVFFVDPIRNDDTTMDKGVSGFFLFWPALHILVVLQIS